MIMHGLRKRSEMSNTKINEPLSLTKQIVFSLLPVTILVIVVELVLRFIGFRFGSLYIEHPIFEDAGKGIMQTASMFIDEKPYGFPFCYNQRFKRQKDKDTVRIIMVGESSVVRLAKAPLLNELLNERFKTRVEIINAGFQGLSSSRVLLAVQEAVNYSPDVIMIYTGHNEFHSFDDLDRLVNEKNFPPAPAWKYDVRIIQALAKLRYQVAPPSRKSMEEYLRSYSLEDKEYNYRKFERNLSEMIDVARHRKIPVVLGTVSYNYGDAPLSAEGFNGIDQLYYLSDDELKEKQQQRPNNSFIEYALGVHAVWRHDYTEAKRLFDLAFLHDTRPVRASTRINEIIRSVANKKNALMADIYAAVVSSDPHGMPEYDFFDDACHLNSRGKTILQETFADTIVLAVEQR